MNRSFRQRVGALAGVLLAGTVVLAWASPASAATASQARVGAFIANCPSPPPAAQQIVARPGAPLQVTPTVTATTIQCGTNVGSAGAQVQGTYSGGTFLLQCSIGGGFVTTQRQIGTGPVVQSATPGSGPVTLSETVDGVIISVTCDASSYPLAVGASGASEAAGPALVTQPAASGDNSGRGTTWLMLAGAAALLVVAGQLAMGRRIGRRRSQATD